MNIEIDRILLSLNDGLEERLLNVCKLRLKTLNESQKFNALEVPFKNNNLVEEGPVLKKVKKDDSKNK